MILWEKCIEEPNLTLYLNSSAMHPLMKDEKTIEAVRVWQSTTFTEFLLHGQIFIDASGDGHIAYEAGAEYRLGREGQDEFGESMASAQPDTHTMGNAVYIQWRDVGTPVPFTPPKWAKTLSDADLLPMKPTVEGAFPENRFHGAHQLRMKSIGFWWIEYGGLLDVIANAEEIRDELWKLAYGIWDKIKNYGNAAETLALEWVQSVPGKRESRRFIGDHVLTQNDIQNQVFFPDRVAYGRHIIDLHPPGAIYARYTPAEYCSTKGLYSIPYRCLYSKDLSNLFLAGRIISVTHVALGTTREQRQTSIIGQVVGTAAALCFQYGMMPREVYPSYITELQQLLLKQDCYILNVKNEDPMDLARNAQVIATSSKQLELEHFTETELNLFELTTPRGQMFLITEPQITHVDLFLESRLSDDVELSLGLRAASSVTDFSSDEDLAITRATVPGTGQPQPVNQQPPIAPINRSWVSFPLNFDLKPGWYWVWLPQQADVYWIGINGREPIGTRRVVRENDQWLPIKAFGSYCLKLYPPSTPYSAENVLSGVAHPTEDGTNIWISKPDLPQSIEITFSKPQAINTVHLTFDPHLDKLWAPTGPFLRGVPAELVRDYTLYGHVNNEWVSLVEETGNYQRHRQHSFPPITTQQIRLEILATNGAPEARVYEIRCYFEEK